MKRVIEKKLVEWKNKSHRKPLVIRGARQTGKTWLVEHFAGQEFDNFIKIDFEKRRDLHGVFEGSLEPDEILKSLEITFGKITPGNTLLFFDEIQACPRAIISLRYFYEELPELHVIAAGSLLEFAFSDISVPVGRLSYLDIEPMTFHEYLLAIDKAAMAEEVLNPTAENNETVQKAILSELKNYFLIGGMPEAVETWVDSKSLVDVFNIQDELLNSYRDDFSKYRPRIDINCLDNVFRQCALRVGEQIKYTSLDRQFSGQTNRKALELLEKARVINRIYSTNPSGLPLGAGVNQKKFKAAFLDIGLMQRLAGMPLAQDYFKMNLLEVFQGRLAEQYVAQQAAVAAGRELYYWSRDAKSSNSEVDFLFQVGGNILPVEVKSGKGGSLRSLHQLFKEYPVPKGIVLYDDVRKQLPEQKLEFYPIYYISSII